MFKPVTKGLLKEDMISTFITPTIGMRVPTTKPKVKIKAQKEALTKMNNLKSISYYRHMKPIFLKSL